MTGVEAVSNGVNAFREPKVRNAHGTLAAIVAILALLLIGIAHVAQSYGIAAMDQTKPGYQSVVSQLVGAVCGRGWFYDVTIGSVLLVLCLSANTSFVDFPRLCRLVAQDGFLPRPFAVSGRRLVYSVGVLFLAVGAGGLLLLFRGITDALIPLFAVGAFLSFTLSQAGMAARWMREAGGRWRRLKLAINGFGAVATGLALLVILAAKFTEGAWLTVIVVPLTIVLLHAVWRYYDEIDRQVLRGGRQALDLSAAAPPVVLVPVVQWDRVAKKALEYALRLSPDVTALHLVDLEGPDADDRVAQLRTDWHDFVEAPAASSGIVAPKLEIIPTQFRSMTGPVLKAVDAARKGGADRPITVILPELVDRHWWGSLMLVNRERRLRATLLRQGGFGIVVSTVPWQLRLADAGDRESDG